MYLYSVYFIKSPIANMNILVYLLAVLVFLTEISLSNAARGSNPRLVLFGSPFSGKHIANTAPLPLPNFIEDLLRLHQFTECEIRLIKTRLLSFAQTNSSRIINLWQPKLQLLSTSQLYQPPLSNESFQSVISKYPEILGYDLVSHLAVRHAYLQEYLTLQPALAYKVRQEEAVKCSDEDFSTLFSSTISINLTQSDIGPTGTETCMSDFRTFKRLFLQGGLAAVRRGDVRMVRLLLDIGWRPFYETDRMGRTALHWACSLCGEENDDMLCIIKLIERAYRDSVEIEDGQSSIFEESSTDGSHCLHWAATGGSLRLCKYILQSIPPANVDDFLKRVNKEGNHPIHWAAGSGALPVLRWLVHELGVLVYLRNIFGCTVAHFASSAGRLEVCEYLESVWQGIMTIQNEHGHDSLTKAIAFKQNHIVSWLLQNQFTAGSGDRSVDTTSLRPWRRDTSLPDDAALDEMLSLEDIADIVGNAEGRELLIQHSHRS